MLRLYSKILGKPSTKLFRFSSAHFSADRESVDILAQLDEKLMQEGDANARTEPYVLKKKDSVVYIKNLQEKASFLSLLKVNTSPALCIGIEKSMVTALVLDNIMKVESNNKVEMHPAGDIQIPLRNLGNVVDFAGQIIFDEVTEHENFPEKQWGEDTINLIKGLRKAPYRRKLVSRQLYTGHLRIDLNQPMVENNFILLKGPSNAGKNLVVKDMIKYFLNDDKEGNRRVVYVTPHIKDAKNLHQNVLDEEERAKCTVVTPRNVTNNSAEVYLGPRSGLVIAQKLRESKCNVLLVFDKLIEYDINEKRIFDNAKQPFSPTNIYNEIMENSGDFGPGEGKMTSVVVLDTDTMNFNYEKYLNNLRIHLESICDQSIDFEPSFKSMKTSLPKIDLLSFTGFTQDFWQKPLVASIRKDLEQFTKILKDSFKAHKSRRELGIQEDPWDNYLYYDSQYIIPLINHKQPLNIVEQILLFKFLHRSMGDDSHVSIKISS